MKILPRESDQRKDFWCSRFMLSLKHAGFRHDIQTSEMMRRVRKFTSKMGWSDNNKRVFEERLLFSGRYVKPGGTGYYYLRWENVMEK